MSGPICPDCGWGMIRHSEDRQSDHCEFCGWEGGRLPYKRLAQHSRQRKVEEFAKKRARRDAGELFFFRVFFEKGSGEDVAFVLQDLLQVEHIPASRNPIFLELEAKPSDETVARVESLPGVNDVKVH